MNKKAVRDSEQTVRDDQQEDMSGAPNVEPTDTVIDQQNEPIAQASSENMPQEELDQEQRGYEEPDGPDKQNDQERNLARLRELRTKAERERDEARREAQEIRRQQYEFFQKAYAQQPIYNDPQPSKTRATEDDVHVNPDDLVEGRHLSRYDKKIKRMEEQLAQYQTLTKFQQAQTALQSRYKDFDSVVSVENVKRLEEKYPEVAETIRYSTDVYKIGATAYELIKRFGIHEHGTYDRDKERAYVNNQKPKPTQAVSPNQGSSPLGRASEYDDGYTEEMRAKIWEQMQKASRYT